MTLIEKLIAQSGEMWKAAKDRTDPDNGVIVCTRSRKGWKAWWNPESGAWVIQDHEFTPAEAASFRVEYGKSWALLLESVMLFNGGRTGMKIRGFVYNGRIEGWNISTEPYELKA